MEIVKINGEYGIKITHVNKEGIKKRQVLSLKKLATAGLTALTLMIAAGIGISQIKDNNNFDTDEALEALEKNELEDAKDVIEKFLELDKKYEELMKDKNHDQKEEVELRTQLVAQIRKLPKIALETTKDKIRKDSNLDENATILITRNGTSTPIDSIIIETTEGTTVSHDISIEINTLLNLISNIESYNGTGENTVWENEIDNFRKLAEETIEYIIEILNSEKEFTYEVTSQEVEKGISH